MNLWRFQIFDIFQLPSVCKLLQRIFSIRIQSLERIDFCRKMQSELLLKESNLSKFQTMSCIRHDTVTFWFVILGKGMGGL